MKMYTKFVSVVREVWQSVVWLTRRSCAYLPQFRYCVFGHRGKWCYIRAALDIAQDIVAYANYLVQGLGVVNVVIGQLLRRDPRKSPASYNDEVLKINTHLQQLTLGLHIIFIFRDTEDFGQICHTWGAMGSTCGLKVMQILRHQWWSALGASNMPCIIECRK